MTCGFGGQPMLSFCDEHYLRHLVEAHHHPEPKGPQPPQVDDEELRRMVKTRGCSLRKLGKRIGVSSATLSRFERGGGLSLDVYRKLRVALEGP